MAADKQQQAYEHVLRARHWLEAHLTANGGPDEDPRSPVHAVTVAIDLLDAALDSLEFKEFADESFRMAAGEVVD